MKDMAACNTNQSGASINSSVSQCFDFVFDTLLVIVLLCTILDVSGDWL